MDGQAHPSIAATFSPDGRILAVGAYTTSGPGVLLYGHAVAEAASTAAHGQAGERRRVQPAIARQYDAGDEAVLDKGGYRLGDIVGAAAADEGEAELIRDLPCRAA